MKAAILAGLVVLAPTLALAEGCALDGGTVIGRVEAMNQMVLDLDIPGLVAAMEERVTYYHEVVEAGMEKVCETVNQLEALTATRDWPYPTFCELLFSV